LAIPAGERCLKISLMQAFDHLRQLKPPGQNEYYSQKGRIFRKMNIPAPYTRSGENRLLREAVTALGKEQRYGIAQNEVQHKQKR
jgi:hypothetical protein